MNPDALVARPTWRRSSRRLSHPVRRRIHACDPTTTFAVCGVLTAPPGALNPVPWDPTIPAACPRCVRLTRPPKDPT